MKTTHVPCRILFLLLFLSLPIINLHAQMDDLTGVKGLAATLPFDGYVVFNNGDTLYGKILWRLKYVENNPVEIRLTTDDGKNLILGPDKIRGFANTIYSGPEYYVSIPSFKKQIPVFMNRFLDGRITVLQNRSALIIQSGTTFQRSSFTVFQGLNFQFDQNGLFIGPFFKKSYEDIVSKTTYTSFYVQKDNGPLIKLNAKSYKTLFHVLFDDCPEIAMEVEKNPDLSKFSYFFILAEVYNNVCWVKN